MAATSLSSSSRAVRLRRCGLTLAISLACSAQAEQPENPHAHLDWIAQDQLPEHLRDTVPAGCCGLFISPLDLEGAETGPLEEQPIDASADRSRAEGASTVVLEGDVIMRQGARQLEAQTVTLERDTGTITLDGEVKLREDGLLLYGDSARANHTSGDAQLDNAEFVLHESRIHGRAGQLQKFGDRLLRLASGRFSTCEPGDEFWQMRAGKIELHPDQHYGTASHARLAIEGLPVAYVPWMYFPIGDKRRTGLLFPSISSNTRNGFEYAQPFYWNIAPQADMTITPRYLEKRGTLLGIEARHLSEFFETKLTGAHLGDDEGGFDRQAENDIADGELTREEAYPHLGDDRWMIKLDQTGGQGGRLTTRIDYTDISDTDYFIDVTSSDVEVDRQSKISKFGRIRYSTSGWDLALQAEQIRYLNESRQKPFRQVPRAAANGRYNWGDWELGLDNEYTRFDLNHHYDRPTDNLVVGERLRTDYGLSWNRRWQWGFFQPRLGVKTLNYQLEQAPTQDEGDPIGERDYTDSPSLTVPQTSLDMGLYLERFGQIGGLEFIQTLEPRLMYFYSDYEDHSALYSPLRDTNRFIEFDTKDRVFGYNELFSTTRFSGGDRIGDANQLSWGLTSRFISPATGVEHLSLSAGQIHRFDPYRVTLNPDNRPDRERYNTSEYVAQIAGRTSERLNASVDAAYNPHENVLSNASATVEYADPAGRLFGLTYTYKRNVRELPESTVPDPEVRYDTSRDQIDAGAYWPISERWSLIGRSHYDFTYERELDTFAGLEYNDCCFRIRVLWRQWLNFDYNTTSVLDSVEGDDYDRGYFIDFQFKGLGNISDRVASLLEDTILGYEQRNP